MMTTVCGLKPLGELQGVEGDRTHTFNTANNAANVNSNGAATGLCDDREEARGERAEDDDRPRRHGPQGE